MLLSTLISSYLGDLDKDQHFINKFHDLIVEANGLESVKMSFFYWTVKISKPTTRGTCQIFCISSLFIIRKLPTCFYTFKLTCVLYKTVY